MKYFWRDNIMCINHVAVFKLLSLSREFFFFLTEEIATGCPTFPFK